MDDIRLSLDIDEEADARLALDENDISATLRLGECIVDGTDDYNVLRNKPSIENVVLVGNKTFPDLGLNNLTNMEIEHLLDW